MQVRSLGGEDPLEKGVTAHSSAVPGKSPMDRGAWRATVHGVTESDRAEQAQQAFWSQGVMLVVGSEGSEPHFRAGACGCMALTQSCRVVSGWGTLCLVHLRNSVLRRQGLLPKGLSRPTRAGRGCLPAAHLEGTLVPDPRVLQPQVWTPWPGLPRLPPLLSSHGHGWVPDHHRAL